MSVTGVVFHLVRHGRVASHRGDNPITDEGQAEIEAAGERFASVVRPGDVVHHLYTHTLRSHQTADTLRRTLSDRLGASVSFPESRREWAIRNPDLFVGGLRYEMMANAKAVAHQHPDSGIAPEVIDRVDFFHDFFRAPDRIRYWVEHESPPGEDIHAVARRILCFAESLLDAPGEGAHRYIAVSHSPVMRAVLVHYLGFDPGEPEYVESIDFAVRRGGATISFRERSVDAAI